MKTKRVISLILALVTVCSLLTVSAVGVSAATNSRMMMSISSKPCSANLSTSELPDVEVPKQGDTFYINFACTSDLKMSRAQIYVKNPVRQILLV